MKLRNNFSLDKFNTHQASWRDFMTLLQTILEVPEKSHKNLPQNAHLLLTICFHIKIHLCKKATIDPGCCDS